MNYIRRSKVVIVVLVLSLCTSIIFGKSTYASEHRLPKSYCLDVNCILQNPELPTGCEVTSLAILLNYLGIEIEKETLGEAIPKGEVGKDDPYFTFIGSPFSNSGLGVFSPAICDLAKDYISKEEYKVQDLSGVEFDDLVFSYLYRYNTPIVVWLSINMRPLKEDGSWKSTEGNTIYWRVPNHCLVLIGFDKDNYIFADPLKGIVSYDKKTVVALYNANRRNAMTIIPKR